MTNCRKSLIKSLLISIVLTLVSYALSLIITGLISAGIARRARLKQSLQSLFPDHDWEFTGVYTHIKHVCFTVWYPDGFDPIAMDAEAKTRELLLSNSPALEKLRFKVAFLPRSKFPHPHLR